MSTAEAPTAIEAIHMRVTYFAAVGPHEPLHFVVADDLARVFRQLDLLLSYAELIATPGADEGTGVIRTHVPDQPSSLGPAQELIDSVLRAEQKDREAAWQEFRHYMEESGLKDIDIARTALPRKPAEPIAMATARLSLRPMAAFGHGHPARVISVRMSSPLAIIVEIPMAVWVGTGGALLLLLERIATAPVRVARKRKNELREAALHDRDKALMNRQTQLINEGKADALALLLLDQGPRRLVRGPDEVVLLDPAEPAGELEPIAD